MTVFIIKAQNNTTLKIYSGKSRPSDLFSGKIYIANSAETLGHPYLRSETYENGTIFTKKKAFIDLEINYDITKHNLLLLADKNSSFSTIVVPSEKVDSFIMGNQMFIRHNIQNKPVFLKLIQDGIFRLYLFNEKQLILDNAQRKYSYSQKKDKWFMQKGDSLIEIRGKKALRKNLPENSKSRANEFFKKNGNFMRFYSPDKLKSLFEYINQVKNYD